MSVIQVPYHLDEYLPDLDVPLPPDAVVNPDLPAGDVRDRLSALYSSLAAAVAGEAGSGGRPVVLSGDCMTALGTMSGLRRAGVEAGIVWFDAHGDVQTPETTTSGYLAGILTGIMPCKWTATPGMPESRLGCWGGATDQHDHAWRRRREPGPDVL